MSFPVDNIRKLCKERNTNLAQLEKKLGYGNGLIAQWENSKRYPPHDRLVSIANELGVTVDELTGKKKTPPTQEDEGLDAEFMLLFKMLSPEQQTRELAYLRELTGERDRQSSLGPTSG